MRSEILQNMNQGKRESVLRLLLSCETYLNSSLTCQPTQIHQDVFSDWSIAKYQSNQTRSDSKNGILFKKLL